MNVENMATRPLHLYTADHEEFVIAASPEDAAVVWKEHAGEALDSDDRWVQMPDERPFRYLDEDTGMVIEKTCGEFAREGRGYLASLNQ